jgi:alkanesulfonate monooxygenase
VRLRALPQLTKRASAHHNCRDARSTPRIAARAQNQKDNAMASSTRTMRLGFSVAANGTHKGAWRHPDAWNGGGLDIDQWAEVAQAAERAKVHFLFWADGAAVRTEAPDIEALSFSAKIDMLEPLTLIAALSQHARNIGFVTTASTSFNEPYHVARKFASLDYITKGRIGWNVVTSWSAQEAKNFSSEKQLEHDERYRRAEEFFDVVTGLWDSWGDDAFIRDKESGRYFDPAEMNILNHKGKYYTVRGPLNVPRPLQGHPVIAQAGASEPGQELAARTADIVYTAQQDVENARAFYASVKGRMAKCGRSTDSLIIMPGIMPIMGRSDQEAQDVYGYLQELLHPVAGLNSIVQLFGDLSKLPLDEPLPAWIDAQTNAMRANKAMWLDRARRENMTIRQLYQAFSVGSAHKVVVGSPKTIADTMEEWFTTGACDGWSVMSAYMPGGIFEFADLVVPELQCRGLHRTEYEGATLRENLGLQRPVNRFARRSVA